MSVLPAFDGCATAVVADTGDYTILLLSDSVANAVGEWGYLWAGLLATRYPTYTVLWYEWDDAAPADWNAPITIQSGTGANTIRLWNGAEGGYGIDEIIGYRPEIIQAPSSCDLVVVALGHNFDNAASDYEDLLDVLGTDWPAAQIELMTENPKLSWDPWEAGLRLRVMRVASDNNLGIADVWAYFDDAIKATGYTDDVHLNVIGSAFFADVVDTLWVNHPTAADPNRSKAMGNGEFRVLSASGSATVTGISLPAATASLEFIVYCAPDDWTSGQQQYVIGGGGNNPVFEIRFNGLLGVVVYDTSPRESVSTVSAGGVDGEWMWIRAVVDWGTSEVTFWKSSDPRSTAYDEVSWTQLGAAVALVATTQIGKTGFFAPPPTVNFVGGLGRAVMIWDGTVEMDVDFTSLTVAEIDAASFLENSHNAATVTFVGTENTDWSAVGYPNPPAGLTIDPATSATELSMSWSAADGATSYRVERSPNGTDSWVDVSGSLGVLTHNDTGLTGGTTYYYRVVAVNAQGDSDPSTAASAATLSGYRPRRSAQRTPRSARR